MILKTIISAVVLLALVIPALGLKQFFDKDAKPLGHSCSHNNNDTEKGSDESCSFCPSDELTNHSV